MNKAIIYHLSIHDLDKNEGRLSRHWMTHQGFNNMKITGKLLEDTATEVDSPVLDSGGLTAVDFNQSETSRNDSGMLAHKARCLLT